jgi:hypothetical protein
MSTLVPGKRALRAGVGQPGIVHGCNQIAHIPRLRSLLVIPDPIGVRSSGLRWAAQKCWPRHPGLPTEQSPRAEGPRDDDHASACG